MKRPFLLTITLAFLLPVTARAFCPTGYALEFDGIDDYVIVSDAPSQQIQTNQITLSAWILLKSDLVNQQARIICKQALSGQFSWGLELYRHDYGGSVGNRLTFHDSDGSAWYHCYSQTDLHLNQWYHVAATDNAGLIKIYVNGALDTVSDQGYGIVPNIDSDIYIGSSIYHGQPLFFFDGYIDEVAMFDRALSAEEIKEVYCGYIDPCDSGLVGYWNFDEGTGQQAYDSTANSNDGQLGSDPSADPCDPNWVVSDILPEPDYYVDDDAPSDPGPWDPCISDPLEDGSSEHPFDNIQEVIDAAYADCNDCCPVILVRDGWYDGYGNYDIDTLGMGLTLKSEHGPWNTIIDPYGKGRGFIITGGETECTVIDGFLIFDGMAKPIPPVEGLKSYEYGGAVFCANSSPTIRNCIMLFNFARYSGGAVYLYQSDASIQRCELLLNFCGYDNTWGSGGGIFINRSRPLIENCVVAGNYGDLSGGITCSIGADANIVNCTVSDNYANYGPDGLMCYFGGHANVKNSIFWTDTRWWLFGQQDAEPDPNREYYEHIHLRYGGSLDISYTDIEGGYKGIYLQDSDCELNWGTGNLNTNPLFAQYYFFDYHLQSAVGRWTWMYESNGDYNNDWYINFQDFAIFALFWMEPAPPRYIDMDNDGQLDVNDLGLFCENWLMPGENFSGWVQDDVNSPCIDAGDPCSPYLLEPAPNGGRINMGAYGNTEQASKSTEVAKPRRHPDLDHDGDVDFRDFALFSQSWLDVGADIEADFDYGGWVDEMDLWEFALWWLWGK